ncbi:MAG: class I SAM-dependent methyltransferase [Actinomycetota bacterium]
MRSKQSAKQLVRRVFGEPYVGKRLKKRNLDRALRRIEIKCSDVLDAGAGDASFVYWLADRFQTANVTALDVDAGIVSDCARAQPRKYTDRVAFEAGEFADLPAESFDLAIALDVLEHIRDDEDAVRELFRALRPRGTLIVHVPRDVWTHSDGRQERVPDAEAWRINEGHVRMGYSPERLCELLERAGFEVVDTQLWLRRWGVRAHIFYTRIEHVIPLRLVSAIFTDLAAVLDRRRPPAEGNTVYVRAVKRVS